MTAEEIQIRYFVVDPKDIVYIKAILESYEGMVVVRTVEVGKPIIELLIAANFTQTIHQVVEALQKEVSLQEINSPEAWSPSSP